MLRFAITVSVILTAAECSVVVTTTGPVRGTLVEGEQVSYYAYLGIPYAESPEGELRFKPPIPKQPWTNVFNATEQGPVCPQPEGKYTRDQMSEDCLSINIMVPVNRTQESLPVFVFIHGGGFKSNAGDINIFYGPDFYIKRDVILATINFRLGALGYLSLDTENAAGNAGLKDALLALKWIKDNIRRFGGSTITIGGQSSGSAMVHYLLLTEKSTGLFDRAMLSSGSATNFRFLAKDPKANALALAEQLGISNHSNIEDILKNLTSADAFDIVDAQENIYKNNRNPMRPFGPFVPNVEKESDHAFITKSPLDIVKMGIPQNVPIYVGMNALEGAYMWPSLHKLSTDDLKSKVPLCIPPDIEYPEDSDEYKDLVDSMSELYFGSKDLSNWTLTKLFNLVTDTQYARTVDSWIRIHKKRHDSAPLYYYVFDFDGDLNWGKLTYGIDFPGTVHADDLGYLFVTNITAPILKTADARSLRTLHNMVTFLTNFIKYGNPSPKGYGGKVIWPESGKHGRHLVIDDCPKRVTQGPFKKRFDFWEKAYNKYNSYINRNDVDL
ncbi:juvenile hormone esterase-like [Ostrinia nubilalis]|uniref:juvenile hormone esterase-like n=1 Tax=Ostrinia nubilalis TaxID=29057 RepID=UPI0030826334